MPVDFLTGKTVAVYAQSSEDLRTFLLALLIYPSAYGLLLAASFFLRHRLARSDLKRYAGCTRSLNIYEVAYLRGHRTRVVAAALVGLIKAGRVEVTVNNKIRRLGEPVGDPVQQALLRALDGPEISWPKLAKRVARGPEVAAVAARLHTDGLAYTSSQRRHQWWLASFPTFVFAGVSAVWVIVTQPPLTEFIPIGLVLFGAVFIALPMVHPPVVTVAGTQAIEKLSGEIECVGRDEPAPLAQTVPASASVAAFDLALKGEAGLDPEDTALRTLLFPPEPPHIEGSGGGGGG